jgi:hypothetical protein
MTASSTVRDAAMGVDRDVLLLRTIAAAKFQRDPCGNKKKRREGTAPESADACTGEKERGGGYSPAPGSPEYGFSLLMVHVRHLVLIWCYT